MEERIEVQKNQESPRANAVKPSELHQSENEKNEHVDVCENAVQAKYRPKYYHLLKYAKEYQEKCKLMNRGKQNGFKADEEFPEDDERVVSRKRSARGSRKAIIEDSTESDEQVDIEKRTKFRNDVRKKQSMQEDARVVTKKRSSPHSRIAIKKFPPSESRNVGESSRAAPARSEVEFRKRVLEIISEPFDMMEYMIIKKEFDSKRYTDHHPELGNELMKWRDNRRKQLALMRGFYFWRQNLIQEGAFKPWRDDVCLAVEAQPSHRGNESEN